MKQFIKALIKRIPIAFTQNQKYDRDTKKVIELVCKENSNCIDIGCHKGEILDLFIKHSPSGRHMAFEPIPMLFEVLEENYRDQNVSLYKYALSEKKGISTFNYVVSNPSYSGIKKRSYDRANEVDTEITVETIPLDMVIPENYKIDFIKIDVEGGEFQVLKGAVDSITKFKPIIIFEHGIGASDHYGTKPEEVFNLLANCNLQIATMEMWLKGQKSFTLKEFEQQFYQRLNYYFIAYPK